MLIEIFTKALDLLKEIVKLCNNNSGFISAMLAIVAIAISIEIGRLPYQKKLSFYQYNASDETEDIIVHVYVSNVGSCPVYIDELVVKEGLWKEIGWCDDVRSAILGNRLINAHETREYQIRLDGYKWTSDKKQGSLRIILKTGRKCFRYRASWAMG